MDEFLHNLDVFDWQILILYMWINFHIANNTIRKYKYKVRKHLATYTIKVNTPKYIYNIYILNREENVQ